MKRYPRTVAFATVMASIAYPAMTIWGVVFLSEGDTVFGLALLACVVIGPPSSVQWRRRFR